jgi:hypothetical protein
MASTIPGILAVTDLEAIAGLIAPRRLPLAGYQP